MRLRCRNTRAGQFKIHEKANQSCSVFFITTARTIIARERPPAVLRNTANGCIILYKTHDGVTFITD
eukprot:jgi/Picre1/30321/NNA_005685.t1